MEGLLRPLDVKCRLARGIARDRFGWQAAGISRLVVMPEDSTVRRQVTRHARIMDVSLPHRSREVRRWLRSPEGRLAGLWSCQKYVPRTLCGARQPSGGSGTPSHAQPELPERGQPIQGSYGTRKVSLREHLTARQRSPGRKVPDDEHLTKIALGRPRQQTCTGRTERVHPVDSDDASR